MLVWNLHTQSVSATKNLERWYEQDGLLRGLLAACPDLRTERSVHQLRDALCIPWRLAVCFKVSSAVGKVSRVAWKGLVQLFALLVFSNFCSVCLDAASSFGYECSVKALGVLEGSLLLEADILLFRINLLRICNLSTKWRTEKQATENSQNTKYLAAPYSEYSYWTGNAALYSSLRNG